MGPKIRNDDNDADSHDPPASRQDGAAQQQAFDEFFNNPALGKDLRTKSVRGGTATIASQAGRFLIGTAGTAVLARILTPGDFGLLAMIAAFTRFLTLFKDLGLSTATIQRKEISHDQVNSLFWINAAIGVGIAILTVVAAPLVAGFYDRGELLWITIVLAIPFVFSGLALQHTALLRRQMRFGAIAVIQVVSAAAGAIAGIIAAWMGAQYWALVAGMIVTNIVTLVVTWRLCRWRPGRPRVTSDSGALVSFGGQITASNFVNYLARNLDNILIGKVCGDAALGVYDKAYQLLLLPLRQFNAPIAAVIIPVLSRLQDKREEFRRAYRTAVGLLAAAGMPVVTLSFVAAPEVVRIFLGPRWDAVVPIFQWLAPAAFVGTTNGAIGWVCISLGRVRRQLAWTLISTPFILAAFVIGVLCKDPVVVAAAFSIVQVVLRWPGLLYCFQDTFIGTRDVVAAVWRPLIASLGAGAGAYALRFVPWSPMHTTLGMFIAMSLSVAALYAGIWLAIPGGRRRLDEVLSLAATILPRRKKNDASATTSE